MTLTMRDVILGLSFLLAFPGAITLTNVASSEPGEPTTPPVVTADVGR